MHNPLYEAAELECFNQGGNRYYVIPKSGIAVPSVTSVIYKDVVFPDTPAMKMARDRGTRVHDICEEYLLHKKVGKLDPFTRTSFEKLKIEIDKHLNESNLVEGALYSMRLLTAGRVDCIGLWDGKMSVIDFKTATNPKKIGGIKNYFIQAAAYAHMWNEVGCWDWGLVEQLVVLITPDNHPSAQIFTEPYDKYRDIMFKKFVADRQ